MKKVLIVLLLGTFAYAQESPEDVCRGAGDYWSEALTTCYAQNAMDADENFVFSEINKLQAQEDRLQHEQQEYNASNQSARDVNLAAGILSLEVKRDASSEQVVKDTYQEEIDNRTNRRQFHVDKDVSNHGVLISDLSVKISGLRKELDIILQ